LNVSGPIQPDKVHEVIRLQLTESQKFAGQGRLLRSQATGSVQDLAHQSRMDPHEARELAGLTMPPSRHFPKAIKDVFPELLVGKNRNHA